jgi:preprotein translocase subunit SecG
MKNIFLIIQIILSSLLITFILMQAKGSGLGTAFGGSNEQYRSKRGVEKILYRGSILVAVLFLITSIINLIIR